MQPWCRFLEDEMNGKLLTQKDVAKQLGIAPGHVRIYAAEGLLEYVQLPDLNKPRYTQVQVDTFLERMTKCHANENHAPAESLSFPLTSNEEADRKTSTARSNLTGSENGSRSGRPTSTKPRKYYRKRSTKPGTII